MIVYASYEATAGWARPIMIAINENLEARPHLDAYRMGTLSDLTFSIETRIGGLSEAQEILTEHLLTLANELVRAPKIKLLSSKAYRFSDDAALRRALIAATYFVTEARTCVENLAEYYREFVREFFDEAIGKERAREFVETLSGDAAWAAKLWSFRIDLSHRRAPWLAFEVSDGEPLARTKALFTLDWRHGTALQPAETPENDVIRGEDLDAIRDGLGKALAHVRTHVVDRLRCTSAG